MSPLHTIFFTILRTHMRYPHRHTTGSPASDKCSWLWRGFPKTLRIYNDIHTYIYIYVTYYYQGSGGWAMGRRFPIAYSGLIPVGKKCGNQRQGHLVSRIWRCTAAGISKQTAALGNFHASRLQCGPGYGQGMPLVPLNMLFLNRSHPHCDFFRFVRFCQAPARARLIAIAFSSHIVYSTPSQSRSLIPRRVLTR